MHQAGGNKARVTKVQRQLLARRAPVDSGDTKDGTLCAPEANVRAQTLADFARRRTDWDLATRLDHCEQALAAAEYHLALATGKKSSSAVTASPPPPLNTLANGSAFDCEEIAAEAAAVDDHRAIDRCIAIASRTERLALSFRFIDRADHDGQQYTIDYVALWVSRIGKVPAVIDLASAPNNPCERVLDSDAWVPCLGLARAAGRSCSRLLFDRARSIALQMLRRHQTLALDGVAKVIHYYDQESPLADDAHVAARLLQAFIAGLVQAPSDMDRDRAMTAARRVAATLIDPIVRFDAGRPLGNVGTVKSVVSNARSAVYHAATSLLGKPLGDAVVYLMGALVVSTERWASCPSQPLYHSLTYRDTFALLARADSLTLEALAEGFDVRDRPGASSSAPEGTHSAGDVRCASGPPLPPDDRRGGAAHDFDILLRLWTHESDIYVDVLSRLDPWDVGSLALTSCGNFARVIASVQADDARRKRRLHPHMALSGDRVMGYCNGTARVEPPPERITPALGSDGPLPDLAVLLFLCRTMPTVEGNLPYDRSSVPGVAARACLLGCGDALNRCLRAISHQEPLQEPRTPWSCESVAGIAVKRKHLVRQLGLAAGRYGSATLMRVAWDQSLLHKFRVPAYGEDRPSNAKPGFVDYDLVTYAITGIRRGLESRDARQRDLCARGLPLLTAVLCDTVLTVVMQYATGQKSAANDKKTRMRVACHSGALDLLAPGKDLPAASARVALAAALARAVAPM
ncbi:hypothetical protein pqer_cds_653 [Pandoravirus quercus]|uniref:DUF5867 domain-containing protein n=1 Tax=Pandoravirus quercus TaxID=2107709 RepID=A0A2U7U9L6_9VIRU|nr:hypothetical protein pqer_cds_653 [Pandoravirus quercus]AVK75075.1 hypothetical protein pqer_cds_653 [Pandoravirus quercus]